MTAASRSAETLPQRSASCRVAVLVPNGFPGLPSYRMPADSVATPIGARLAVPFGGRMLTGVLAGLEPPLLPEGTVERDVAATLDDEPFLPPALVDVLLRAAAYYFAPPGEMLRAAVPARLLAASAATFEPAAGFVGARPDDAFEARVLDALMRRGQADVEDLAEDVGGRGLGRALRNLVAQGFLRIASQAMKPARAPVDKAWIARPATGAIRGAKRGALLAHLVALGRPASSAELRVAGFSPSLLLALSKDGLVTRVESERRADLSEHVGRFAKDTVVELTPAQRGAVDAIRDAIAAESHRTFLVDGVTGSGKTEVYLAALEAARSQGRQGILLVPEIALAPALVRRILARFGDRVSLLHSGLSEGERASEWERARRGDVDAVVGPRSAVFAPLPRLGLVVVDEAHESSYKQAESPRYDARDVARVRAHVEGATLVFGSATPVMEHERAAREGRLPRLELPERPGSRARASVEVVDLRHEPAREGDHGKILFAQRTVEILSTALVRKEQVLVLLNRRGFSPSLLCRACGEDFRCGNCSVTRTYHRHNEQLLCHYCGDSIRRPIVCPTCRSGSLMPIGFGTERLAERFEEVFPGVSYAVLDRDAAARKGGAAGVLADFESGRARALLGTQMIAKGHDFPNATALAVLDADALLSFPDFRSAERTFQLVTQAAGRVGRGDRPGLVAVQTARPEHEAIRAAVAQDHATFASSELRFRRAFRYPPYTRLLLALFSDEDAAKAARAARAGYDALAADTVSKDVRVLGPAPAPFERLKGLWRFHLLVKAESRDAIARAGRVLSGLAEPPRLDVDPQSLL